MARRATLLVLAALAATPGAALAGDLVVIVHAERHVQLSAAEVAQIYLKKRRFWNDGERILPVNRDSSSEARETFARAVFGEEVRQLRVYWNRQYFRGVHPPATLASDEAVKRFVGGERLAIGYIDPGLVDASVSVALRLDHRQSGSGRTHVWALGAHWLRSVLERVFHRSRSLLIANR